MWVGYGVAQSPFKCEISYQYISISHIYFLMSKDPWSTIIPKST